MDALDAARAALPTWVCWVTLLYPPALVLAAWLGLGLAVWLALRPLRGHDKSPWYERARRAYPGRLVVAAFGVLAPILLAVYFSLLVGPLAHVRGVALGVLCAAAALLPACRLQIRQERRFRGDRATLASWARGRLIVALVFVPNLLVMILLALVMPDEMGRQAWLLLGVGMAATAAFTAGAGLWVGRFVGLLRPASDRLRRLVAEAAAAAGVWPRDTYEVGWTVANAFAHVVSRDVVFTQGALDVLDDAEIRAVAAHELAHLGEPRAVWLARVSGSFLLLPLAVARPAINSYGYLTPLAAWAGIILAGRLVGRLGRRMEERADRAGRAQEGEAGTYARALAKIAEANLAPVVLAGRGAVHPHVYDRLTAAGLAPDYPRPPAPSRARTGWPLFLALVIAQSPLIGLVGLSAVRVPSRPGRETGFLWHLALTGGNGRDLVRLGRLREARGDAVAAETFYRAAAVIDRRSPFGPQALANFLLRQGRLEESFDASLEARRRTGEPHRP